MRRATLPRVRDLNPLRLLSINTKIPYERLPGYDNSNASPFSAAGLKKLRWRSPSPGAGRFPIRRLSLSRLLTLAVTLVLFLSLLVVGGYRGHQRFIKNRPSPRVSFPWEHYPRLNGFYNGLGTLVPLNDWIPEQQAANESSPDAEHISEEMQEKVAKATTTPPMSPKIFNPYEDLNSYEYLKEHNPVKECFLDERDTVRTPDIFAYPGLPQNMTAPFFGSYEVLGLKDDVCFDRFGRLGPYGYGYSESEGGLGLAEKSESSGTGRIWENTKKVDWRMVDWGTAQSRCYEKNKNRFERTDTKRKQDGVKKLVPRQAFILRTWTGYTYDAHQILTMRAMISELALKSGGEYDVHLLVHVKDDTIPIWTDKEVYRQTLEQYVPEEFWGIATLWSEPLIKLYYPDHFDENFENPSQQPVHGVYRGAHFSLQWFSQQHPEYDYFWNWEMDLRFTGHYYEFTKQITNWAKQQPRKGLWERSSRYYISELHGSWANFAKMVEEETMDDPLGPIWGPTPFPHTGMLPSPGSNFPPTSYAQDNYEWGVGEEADLVTFNPLFDTSKTNWVFRNDVNGYSTRLPIPPRRCAIITVSRLSKRLLQYMHEESYKMHHSMFPEMWPPSVALHHGMKAAYIPHPVYFDRNWPVEKIDQVFNRPEKPTDSVFGGGEHNHMGSTFYYNSGFSGALWRRWFGYRENNEGGTQHEVSGTGRMCLRSVLFHPIKFDRGPTE